MYKVLSSYFFLRMFGQNLQTSVKYFGTNFNRKSVIFKKAFVKIFAYLHCLEIVEKL